MAMSSGVSDAVPGLAETFTTCPAPAAVPRPVKKSTMALCANAQLAMLTLYRRPVQIADASREQPWNVRLMSVTLLVSIAGTDASDEQP